MTLNTVKKLNAVLGITFLFNNSNNQDARVTKFALSISCVNEFNEYSDTLFMTIVLEISPNAGGGNWLASISLLVSTYIVVVEIE